MKKAHRVESSDSNDPERPKQVESKKPTVHWALRLLGEIMCFPLVMTGLALFTIITRVDPPGLVNFCVFIAVGAAVLRVFNKPPIWAALMTPAIFTGQLKSGLEDLDKSPWVWIVVFVLLTLILGMLFQMFSNWVNRRSNRTTAIIWTLFALAYCVQVWFTMQHLAGQATG